MVSPEKTLASYTRPETELLLCCAQASVGSQVVAQTRILLEADIDWEYLLRAARVHGMMPLLYRHLAPMEGVPENILTRLRNHFHTNSQRNLFLTGELLRLMNLFEAQGVDAVPYKGPVLAAFAYGNLALRQFIDLDILVHKRDLPEAEELLVSAGYRPRYRLTRAQEAAFLKSQLESAFMHRSSGSVVELHCAVLPRVYSFPLDLEHLWRRLERVSLGGGSVPTLAPEDLLLTLCAHGSKHLWERLAWIRDVAGVIEVCKGMNWERAMHQAETVGGRRMLSLGLLLARDLLGAALPEQVSQKAQADPVVNELVREVRERLFGKLDGSPETFGESLFHPFRIKMRERLRDKARDYVRTLVTPGVGDWGHTPLPDLLFPLYYVLRPVRLTRKFGRRMIERLL